jgi:hypothetical protein
MRQMRVCLILFAILLAGCREPSGTTAPAPKTTRDWLARYAELRASRATRNALLRDEFFRVESESGLPLQLATDEGHGASSSAQAPLKAITSTVQLSYLDRRLAFVFPQLEFIIAERHVAEIDRLGDEYSELRTELDRFSRAENWTIDLAFDEGALFAGHFVPCIESALKLELTTTGLCLRRSQWTETLRGFDRVWRSIEILASQPHLESRVLAAKLRAPSLRLLEAMLASPECEASEVRRFRDLMAQCLTDWPDDNLVWRGERARAMHFFEMIRDGQVLSLANDELTEAIDDHGGAKDFGLWLHAHVDADELYYLVNMRRVIAFCDFPFYERNSLLRDLEADLQRRAKSDDDPILSRLMLLGDIEPAMRWQASDRLHCEAMLIALENALGDVKDSVSLRNSPLTGRAYRITTLQRLIRVDGDSELKEFGYVVATPRYDLELARMDEPAPLSEEEEELEPQKVAEPPPFAPRKGTRRTP